MKQGPVKFKNVRIKKSDVQKFAVKIGRHLLKNEKYLDKLADALDGIDISDTEAEYDSESPEEESQNTEEQMHESS